MKEKLCAMAKRLWMPVAAGLLLLAALITAPWPGAQRTAEQGLTVWFLDVGQADAALLVADGHALLIDGGNTADSSLIVSFLRKQGIAHLDAVVCTHAHEDHVGGLAAALKVCTADRVYAPVTAYDSKAFRSFQKYADRRGCALTVPLAGDRFLLGGASVCFLSPVAWAETVNDTSLVLRVDYGQTSFLFTGDAERAAELQLLDAGSPLGATVLKVSHHGSDSATSYVFLREVMPAHAVISVGLDNRYGFPDEAVLSRLSDAGAAIYRTDLCGDIVCTSDGSAVEFTTERAYDGASALAAPGNAAEASLPAGTAYVGNIGSMKFHRPDCGSLPAEDNRRCFSSREEAVEAGYAPCKRCKP